MTSTKAPFWLIQSIPGKVRLHDEPAGLGAVSLVAALSVSINNIARLTNSYLHFLEGASQRHW